MFRLDEFAILPDGTLSAQDGVRFVSLGFDLLEPLNPEHQYPEAIWSNVTMRAASVTGLVMRQASTDSITLRGG